MSKVIIKLDLETTREFRKEFKLEVYSSFTNTEQSELCYQYRVETGFAIENGRDLILSLVDTKDETGKIITTCELSLSKESLGLGCFENFFELGVDLVKGTNSEYYPETKEAIRVLKFLRDRGISFDFEMLIDDIRFN